MAETHVFPASFKSVSRSLLGFREYDTWRHTPEFRDWYTYRMSPGCYLSGSPRDVTCISGLAPRGPTETANRSCPGEILP